MRQRELNVINPSYPELPSAGVTSVTNKYLWSDDLALPTSHRLNVGADRQITANMRFNVGYTYGWGRGLLRGRNLNAPVDGVRPDHVATSLAGPDAEARSHSGQCAVTLLASGKRTFFRQLPGRRAIRTHRRILAAGNGDNIDRSGPSAGERGIAQVSI